MRNIPTLWRANAIVFISSFCVMVIELIAARILAPYIGVSLYTWTSIIGIILTGIALGNYLGGKIADRHPSPFALVAIFFVGSLATMTILPATAVVTSAEWFESLPVMWNFTLTTFFIFFFPVIILSMVSPLVIKLTLADLGQTGGIVGTIYAYSTAGSILGTFMTGFWFILWFGTRMIVWLVAGVLIVTGIIGYLTWRIPGKWSLSRKNLIRWTTTISIVVIFLLFFQTREAWQEDYTKESNYFTIDIVDIENNVKVLYLDNFDQSYINPDKPTHLIYAYLKMFSEIVSYITQQNPAPKVLHLGGGAYCFPRYMEAVYPKSVNEVVEIDPAVTQVVHEELGLSRETNIKTYNQDARRFLIQKKQEGKYDIIIGDVFNDQTTPYHLTTLEFHKLVKDNMKKGGIYLANITDNYEQYGRYLASFVHTLRQVFMSVYVFRSGEIWGQGTSDFVIAATDRPLDIADYTRFVTQDGERKAVGNLQDPFELNRYVAVRDPILLTDDHVPTDILVAPLFKVGSDDHAPRDFMVVPPFI